MKPGSEAFQVLKAHLKPTILILIWMTGLRALLYFFVFYWQIKFHSDLASAFWSGFRFDLLVLGFFWIPFVAFVWLLGLFGLARKLFLLWKVYFVFVIVTVASLSWLDLFWTASHNTRLNSEIFKSSVGETLNWGWFSLGGTPAIISTILILYSSYLLFVSVGKLQSPGSSPKVSKSQLTFEVFISIILVAFAARGTWTPHHLNIEHSQVSSDPQVNQLPLNAPWNLDK